MDHSRPLTADAHTLAESTPTAARAHEPSGQGALIKAVHARIDELFARDGAVFGRDLAPTQGTRTASPGWSWASSTCAPSGSRRSLSPPTSRRCDLVRRHLGLPAGSESLAVQELSRSGHAEDAELVTAMIDEHHRVRPAKNPHPLVEAMRRADATDVHRVVMPQNVSRDDYRALRQRFPDAKLHLMLGRGFVMGLKERKRLNPMPMVKL